MTEPITSSQAVGTLVTVFGIRVFFPELDGGLLVSSALGAIIFTSLNINTPFWPRLSYGLLSLFCGYMFGPALASVADAGFDRLFSGDVLISANEGAVVASLVGVYFVRGIISASEQLKDAKSFRDFRDWFSGGGR